jgi:dihydroflavonol-4-reductase
MDAFVTGSTGLLGNNLVRLLVQQGHKVKALVRSREKAAKLFAGLDLAFIQGDMKDIEAFAPELEGSDVLFHTAAYFRDYYQPGDHWQELELINVTGTVQLLEQAEKAGVKKTIYVSSAGVIGSSPMARQVMKPALHRGSPALIFISRARCLPKRRSRSSRERTRCRLC